MSKTSVGLIYGGLSSEHEVSIKSACNVYDALDKTRYDVIPIWIDTDGRWFQMMGDDHLRGDRPGLRNELVFHPMCKGHTVYARSEGTEEYALTLDVAFPILHGQNGEDGRVQGFLHTLGIPHVGADVLSSAACMDKEVTKRLLRDAGLPVTPFKVVYHAATSRPAFDNVAAEFGIPFFVKPANSGSSVGISKVTGPVGYDAALASAFEYDKKILIEKGIVGREIECAVLGNETPKASTPGEVVATDEFYTYDAKYVDEDASWMEVPANIPDDVAATIRNMSEKACKVLGCEGMARVDFFYSDEGEVLLNEINTIPGFTSRSMYPLMWEHSGLSYLELLTRLIDLALERHDRDSRIKTSR